MKTTLEQLITQLDESGVLSAEEITDFLQTRSAEVESAEELGNLLVKHKKVTRLQVELIYQGKGKLLQLGNYVLLDKIGSGGMGDVYLAQHRRMQRKVALKLLPTVMAAHVQTTQRFQREVQAAAKLSHPNIVTAHDADEAQGTHYLVMEFVEGIDLSALVKKQGVLSVEQALDYILQAARGLEYAHQEGIVHRDIKPSNMLLDKNGTIKILDMGLARIDNLGDENPVTALTQSGSVMGTVDYMSPEQAQSTRSADCRSDIYSLGCTLYYLLTGKTVYRGETFINKILAHRDHPIPSLSSSNVLAPLDVDAIYQKMIAKRPEDRFQSMQELIGAIENCGLLKSFSAVSIEQSNPDFRHDAESERIASNPTTIMPAEMFDAPQETSNPGFGNNTLGGTRFEPSSEKKQPTGKRNWIIAGLALVSLVLMAGIVFNRNTTAGTISLDIDQPDAEGAVVSVDEQQKFTISTGTAQKTITVAADEQQHTLKVAKAGFKTFTRQFTVKIGEIETISIRLVPLNTSEQNTIVNPPKRVNHTSLDSPPLTDREIAEWVIGMGGSVNIDGTRYSTLEELPSERLNIVEIILDDTSVADEDLERLAGLESLKFLFLRNTMISDTGVRYLKEMQEFELQNLSLDYTQVTDVALGYIHEMPKLKRLTLIGTGITNSGMKLLKDMQQLVNLNLAYLQIDDAGLAYLENLTNLEELRVNNTPVTDSGLKHLQGMRNLYYLQLGSTAVTDSGLEQIEGLQSLGRLDITNCQITDSGLEHLKKLKNLKLLGLGTTAITDEGLQQLANLPKLETLRIPETKVTPQGIAELQKALPNCNITSDFKTKTPATK